MTSVEWLIAGEAFRWGMAAGGLLVAFGFSACLLANRWADRQAGREALARLRARSQTMPRLHTEVDPTAKPPVNVTASGRKGWADRG